MYVRVFARVLVSQMGKTDAIRDLVDWRDLPGGGGGYRRPPKKTRARLTSFARPGKHTSLAVYQVNNTGLASNLTRRVPSYAGPADIYLMG